MDGVLSTNDRCSTTFENDSMPGVEFPFWTSTNIWLFTSKEIPSTCNMVNIG